MLEEEKEKIILDLAMQTWPSLAESKPTNSSLAEKSRYLCKILRNKGEAVPVSEISRVLCMEFGSSE